MISGDELIMTRKGLHINKKSLESIGIYEGSQVYLFPMQTFEFREEQPGAFFPMDLIITPIAPKRWPFVMRFVLYLNNRPGMLQRASKMFSKLGINIIFTESTRSGHHHTVVNTLGEIIRLEVKTLEEIFYELKFWKEDRCGIYKSVYDFLYSDMNETSFYSKGKKEPEEYFDEKWSSLFKKMAVDDSCIITEDEKDNKGYKGEKTNNGINDIKTEDEKSFAEPPWWEALCGFIDEKEKIKEYNEVELNKEKWEIKRKIYNAEKGFDCYEGKNRYNKKLIEHAKLIGYLLAITEREFPNKNKNTKDLLEYTINEASPQVSELEDLNLKDIINRKELYRKVENIMLIPKMLLSVILTYKRMLCERYKLLFIWDSLQGENMKKGGELDTTPPEVYLYNIRYYKYLISHPYFCEKTMFTSNSKAKYNEKYYEKNENFPKNRKYVKDIYFWRNKLIDIINGLDNLPPDRKGPLNWNPRLDLDPVTITSVESLSHAYYHQAYEEGFKSTCKDNLIPFNNGPHYPEHFVSQVLPKSNSSTVAVASINTDSMTMRICPLSTRSIDRFRKINFKEYKRTCTDNCHKNKMELTSHDIFEMDETIEDNCNELSVRKFKFTDASLSAFYEKLISVKTKIIIDKFNSGNYKDEVLIKKLCDELNKSGLELPNNLKEKIREEVLNLVGNFVKENLKELFTRMGVEMQDKDVKYSQNVEEKRSNFNEEICKIIKDSKLEDIVKKVCAFINKTAPEHRKHKNLLKILIESINEKFQKMLIIDDVQKEHSKCIKEIFAKNIVKLKELEKLLLKESIEAKTKKEFEKKIRDIVVKSTLFDANEDKYYIKNIVNLLVSLSDNSVMDVCMESSIGLASLITKVITEQKDIESSDGIKNNMNIWRTYNKLYSSSSEGECGSMNLLVQATERYFKGISKDLTSNLANQLRYYINKVFPGNHIVVNDITVGKISAGKVFVAIPFSHPASKYWIDILKEEGKEYGFTDVDTVEEYIDPVTNTVADKIRESHALIQVLALPLDKCSKRNEKYFFDAAKISWVNAEYLTAIALKLKVVRMVDEISIDENEINIGKDHAALHFSSIKPNDFKEKANEAFRKLREGLMDTLGLSESY